MKAKTTKSAFSSIYLSLALIAAAVMAGFYLLSTFFVAPRLVQNRAESILSVIRSHQEDIVLNRPRAVREELLRASIISDERQLSHYFFDEKAKVEQLANRCDVSTERYCLTKNRAVFFIGNSNLSPRDRFKFAVVLEKDLTAPPASLYLWQAIAAMLIGVAFFLLKQELTRKEKYLLSRLSTAKAAFMRARTLLSDTSSGEDEYDVFGKSAEELVDILESYKASFERKTRLEQLALTIGQVSHDLKAPLNEAENFLTSLPLLMKSSSPEAVEDATRSLIHRIRSSKEALDSALKATSQNVVARNEISLGDVLNSVSARAQQNPRLQRLFLNIVYADGCKALGDQLKLETALLNLLENSSDERPDAHILLGLAEAGSGLAKITYEDNAGGIPEENLNKIFEPLITFKANGTGLGLSSTREIITQHGGEIRALPNRGGAKFEIILPISGGANA